ncbi:ATP-binding protein [Rahnella aceris]|jgi:signal transduction histidine kinase|uniref:ATP-binding protein n=1 Tax=Rahnella sp. (strain Y9602) TaxID=2703885 RepID=UPI00364E813A
MDSISFQTRARTIDHLGREQIADCPTAISELWKNSYDAYARKVELNIFERNVPVATLVDDGHGMNSYEFRNKWLVVGTESKATGDVTKEEDRAQLKERVKQGQKGIGRLSCAALGSLLLIVTKRKDENFVAALIDWRFFENPYLMLSDVQIPIIDFENKETLFENIPSMFDELLSNIYGDVSNILDSDRNLRNKRLTDAWDKHEYQENLEFDKQKKERLRLGQVIIEENYITTKQKILNTAKVDIFENKMLDSWGVWRSISASGTIMLMAEIHDDLKAQIPLDGYSDIDSTYKKARDNLKQTLINFTDPFTKGEEPKIDDFTTSVIVWNGHIQRVIIDDIKSFDLSNLELLEHLVEGNVDEEGYFCGTVKAFGVIHENVVFKPKKKYSLRSNSRAGSFNIRIGAYEFEKGKSTLPDDLNAFFREQSELYGGMRIYRDGLRVMPYGREDNDYFEIEKRRTLNAGRHFWSNRRTFGRVSISRADNPNLKDKAGREGLLDNTASKVFREIVENILITAADCFFGSKSEIRQTHLIDSAIKSAAIKAEGDRKKLIINERKRIKKSIDEKIIPLNVKLEELKDLQHKYTQMGEVENINDAKSFKSSVSILNDEIQNFSLSPVPNNLGSIEKDYKRYRALELEAKSIIRLLDESANIALANLSNKTDYEIASEVFNDKRKSINSSIRRMAILGKEMLQSELNRFNELVDQQTKLFQISLVNTLEDLNLEKISLALALGRIDEEYQKQTLANNQRLIPYITAIKNIRDQIDLEGLAIHSINESAKWKKEAERLNSLAQLGITVEIIGHEIEGLDSTIARGLSYIQNANFTPQEKRAFDDVIYAQQGLSDKWRFLSPLKLSGEKTKKLITGKDIYNYIVNFFGSTLSSRNINLSASEKFINFSFIDFPSRIYPVFINLINNSRYWVSNSDNVDKVILLDFSDGEVFVSDNGPGVDPEDYDQLFTLFFTRKHVGGRGVGLYLCRTNLQPAGHEIRYETNDAYKKLSGANFVLKFNGINK